MGQTDAVDFPGEAHSRLFQAEAKIPIDQADGREVLDPGKAQRTQLGQDDFGNHERIGRADAGQNRSALDGGQDLVGHFPNDGVGVSIRHQPCQRPAAGHPEPARIVDHDQVDSPGFLALGAQARACAAADQRTSRSHLLVKPL